MNNRIINTELVKEEVNYEGSLRPENLAQYIGQTKVKENLKKAYKTLA